MYLFELRPNSSLTPRQATLIYLSIAAVPMAVAIGFASRGLWPILPFAGLEVLGLGVALALSVRRGRTREYIRLDEQTVQVRKTTWNWFARETEFEFARPWTRVELRKAGLADHPSRLLIRHRTSAVEVGSFLTERERRSLGRRLARLVPGPGA